MTAPQNSTARWLGLRADGGQAQQQRWERAVRRAARIVEPAWPEGYSTGPFSDAIGVLAMVGFVLVPDEDPEEVSADDLLNLLRATPESGRVGDRLTAALAARGQADSDLTRALAPLRTKPSAAEWERAGMPDPLSLPSESVPDFREPLASIIEWITAALTRPSRGPLAPGP